MPIARDVASVIAGEAVSGSQQERWNDMVHIASVIANRAAILGVSPQEVVANQNEFNAYGKQMPPGTTALTGMAEAAMRYVEQNGPVTDATFYATPAAVGNLPKGLTTETQTTGHVFKSDPNFRAINTAVGLMTPNPQNLPSAISGDPLQAALTQPVSNGILTNGVTAMMSPFAAPEAVTSQSMPAVAADPAFTPSGWLAGTPETFAGLNTPETTGWNDMAAAGPVSAPMDVTATGQVKGTTQTPGYASVGLLGITPTADNMAGLGAPASAAVGAVPSTQSFDVSRFGDPAAQVASASGSVAANPGLSAMASVPMSAAMFSPAVAPTSDFASLAAAGPITTSGISSPEAMAVQAQADKNLAAMNAASVAQNVTPTGLLGASPDLAATASVPSSGLLSSYAASQPVPAGIQAINAIAPQSSSLLSGQPLDTAPTTLGGISQPVTPGLLSMAPVDEGQYQSFTPTQTVQKPDINIATDPAVSMPSLQTVSIPDQPTIAGPIGNYDQEEASSTSTPQINTTAAFPSAPKPVGILGQMGVNKPMLAGGLLGAATLGPIGGLIGGLLGNQIAQQGGLKNVFGGGFGSFTNSPMSINNIGGGLTNVQSVYGGAPAGTQANTSNGGTVTATGGGWSVYTSPDGVSSSVGPNGLHASYFGPSLGGPSTGGGGFDPSTASPGLF